MLRAMRAAGNVPVAEVAADDEEVLLVCKVGGERCRALLQNFATEVADHDGHELHGGGEETGDEGVVKLEAERG